MGYQFLHLFFFPQLPVRGPRQSSALLNPPKTSGVSEGLSGPWICCVQSLVAAGPGRAGGPEPVGGGGSSKAPGELGVARPQRASVCVCSAALLSPACTDATFFLFQIFTADFSLHSCLGPTLPCCFWSSCSFQWRLRGCGDTGGGGGAFLRVKQRLDTNFVVRLLLT